MVFTIAYFVNSYQVTQENLQQDRQNLVQAETNLDAVVNTAVVHCQQNPGEACNIIMKQWQEACQGDEYKDIKSCHDGRIEAYFKNVDLSSSSSIPQTSISQENTSESGTSQIDSASLDVLDSCSTLLQNINDERQTLAGGIPSNALSNSLGMAYNQPINDSQDSLKSCNDGISTIKQQCIKDPSMSVCKDPRLDQLRNTINGFIHIP